MEKAAHLEGGKKRGQPRGKKPKRKENARRKNSNSMGARSAGQMNTRKIPPNLLQSHPVKRLFKTGKKLQAQPRQSFWEKRKEEGKERGEEFWGGGGNRRKKKVGEQRWETPDTANKFQGVIKRKSREKGGEGRTGWKAGRTKRETAAPREG